MSTLYVRLRGLLVGGHFDGEKAAVVVADKMVIDVNAAAAAVGLSVGMGVREAQSLAPGLQVCPFTEGKCDALRAEWLDLAREYADEIETPAPHEAYLNLTPHPKPEEVAQLFLDQLRFPWVAGLCPTKWVAKAMARHPLRDVPLAGLALAPEPVQILAPLPVAYRERLALLGYKKVRHVQALSIETLRGQFGVEAHTVHSAAEGGLHEPVISNYPAPSMRRQRLMLGGCADREQLSSAMGGLARALFVRLGKLGLCAKEAELTVTTESGTVRRHMRQAKPFRGAHGLHLALIRLFEAMEVEEPVEKLSVTLPNLALAPTRQRTFAGLPGADTHDAEDALEALRHKFGPYSIHLAAEHQEPRRVHVLRAWANATGWQ